MLGREKETEQLQRLFDSNRFEFLVMYGRRRIGKTTILDDFAKKHNSIFYPAQEKNDAQNLEEFSRVVQVKLDGTYIAPFTTWNDAFEYIDRKVSERIVIIIDEFPFIARENPSVKSVLQHVIDHKWKNNNSIFLILCGSAVSFMETEVMGNRSPLHARQTASMEVLAFDYIDSSRFFPSYSNEQKLLAYGILGGVPRYLEAFDDRKSIEENISDRVIKTGAYLNDEPVNLLRAELREINVYNSILSAIACGKNRPSEIGNAIHEEVSKVSKYLITLQTMRLVDKVVPCGESQSSRKGIYVIKDNFLKFYFRYKFTNNAYYAMLGEKEAAKEILADVSNLMGDAFEGICKEYMTRMAKSRKLPFIPYHIGKWWGTNQAIKAQDDVDLLMIDKTGTKGIFTECKYISKPMEYGEYEDLKTAMLAFPDIKEKHMCFISKSGYTASVEKAAKEDGAVLLTIDDLFDIE